MDQFMLDEADEVLSLIALAKEYRVEYEVMATVIDQIRVGVAVAEACQYARREWDV